MESKISKIYNNYQMLIESESPADKAHRLGLEYAGYSKWKDKSGKVVAKTVGNELIMIDSQGFEKKISSKKPERKDGNDPYKNIPAPDQHVYKSPETIGKEFHHPVELSNVPPEFESNVNASKALMGNKALGTNPGGFVYLDSKFNIPNRNGDAQRYYMKIYDNPEQGICEDTANSIYRLLELFVPNSSVRKTEDNLLAYMSRDLTNDGKTAAVTLEKLGMDAITQEDAREFLQGFAADVLLSNWDVMGLTNDNILVIPRPVGDRKMLWRIDNGSSLLYRAQGTRKSVEHLHQLSEWDGFSNPHINSNYAKMFKAAGWNSAKDMGVNILAQIRYIDHSISQTYPLFASIFSNRKAFWGNSFDIEKLLLHRKQLLLKKAEEVKGHIASEVVGHTKDAPALLNDVHQISNHYVKGETVSFTFPGDPIGTLPLRILNNSQELAFEKKVRMAGKIDAINQARNFRSQLPESVARTLYEYQRMWTENSQYRALEKDTRNTISTFFDDIINGKESPNGKKAEVYVPDGGYLYRGMDIQPKDWPRFIAKFKIGESVKLPTQGYTYSRSVASDFTGPEDGSSVSVVFKIKPKTGNSMAGLHLSHSNRNYLFAGVEPPPNPLHTPDEDEYHGRFDAWRQRNAGKIPSSHPSFDKQEYNEELEVVRPSNAMLRVANVDKHVHAQASGNDARTHFTYTIELEDEGLDTTIPQTI